MTVNLTFPDYRALAKTGKVIPITLKLFGGNETPVGVFQKLAGDKPGAFLLESAEQGVWSRYSFIGITARNEIRYSDGNLEISNAETVLPTGKNTEPDPLKTIEIIQSAWQTVSLPDLPPLTSGLVGLFGWDLIREIENIPANTAKAYESPTIHLQLVRDLVVVDHLENSLLLVSNIYCTNQMSIETEYELANQRLESMKLALQTPSETQFTASKPSIAAEIESNQEHEEFLAAVARAKEYVRIGDVFQVVISQRFSTKAQTKPLDVYRVLRSINPSPYMYLLNFADQHGPYSVVGSSPEALVKLEGKSVTMHPIAGSRPRGKDATEDNIFSSDLLADKKEQAEHLMLVDLARNDLLKVCNPDSISVKQFMKIEKFSHVMHLVSNVEGNLTEGASAIDLLKATFPAGTLSGAPKPRALEIIEELEPDNRGIFGGVVGYLDFAGNADLAIAIRTAFIRGDQAYVQAGAGIVLDSVAESEYQETINKASAVLRAINQANSNFGN